MSSTVDVWFGRAKNSDAFEAFFEESYEVEDAPISAFAVSQNEPFYDHDFLERVYNPDWKTAEDALLSMSFSGSFAEELLAKLSSFDYSFSVASFTDDFKNPDDYEGDGIRLVYIGRFAFDSKALPHRYIRQTDGSCLHILEPHRFEFEGEVTNKILLDERGLMIGTPSPYGRFLDISAAVPDLADCQLRFARVKDGSWEIRDFGNNGLTKLAGVDFDSGKANLVHDDRFSIGDVAFRWSRT